VKRKVFNDDVFDINNIEIGSNSESANLIDQKSQYIEEQQKPS